MIDQYASGGSIQDIQSAGSLYPCTLAHSSETMKCIAVASRTTGTTTSTRHGAVASRKPCSVAATRAMLGHCIRAKPVHSSWVVCATGGMGDAAMMSGDGPPNNADCEEAMRRQVCTFTVCVPLVACA